MKGFWFVGLGIILIIVLVTGGQIFSIIPQPIGLRQYIFLFIVIISFIALLFLHLTHRNYYALPLFFFTYPFLSQSVHYFNVSGSFFLLTPPLLFLIFHTFLRKDHPPTQSLGILYLFCISLGVSVLLAANYYTATAFFILAVGGFALTAHLIYLDFRSAYDPIAYLRVLTYSIVIGSLIYFCIEIVAFRIQPKDVIYILMRRWELISNGRYFTGGYREPAGIGYMYSIVIWILVSFVRDKSNLKFYRWLDRGLLMASMFILLIAGTRSAIFTLFNIFIVLWLVQKEIGIRRFYKFRSWHIAPLAILLVVSTYLLIPRTINSSRSYVLSSWYQPTTVSIFGKQLELIGTTGDYVNRTLASWKDFVNNPLGSGPLNVKTSVRSEDQRAINVYYSFISNLIVTGATYGWFSLGLWLFFLLFVTWKLYQRRRTNQRRLLSFGVTLLAILLGMHLPGSYYIGPMVNWTNFDPGGPLTPLTSGLPAEYPSLLSGLIIGSLVGLIYRINPKGTGEDALEIVNPPITKNKKIRIRSKHP